MATSNALSYCCTIRVAQRFESYSPSFLTHKVPARAWTVPESLNRSPRQPSAFPRLLIHGSVATALRFAQFNANVSALLGRIVVAGIGNQASNSKSTLQAR